MPSLANYIKQACYSWHKLAELTNIYWSISDWLAEVLSSRSMFYFRLHACQRQKFNILKNAMIYHKLHNRSKKNSMFIKASHEANMSKEVNFGKIACRSPHRQLRFHSTLPPFSLIFLERRAVNKSVKYDLPPCYQNISTVQTIWLIAI